MRPIPLKRENNRILYFKCDYCKTELNSRDTFVVNAENKHFCIKINPGHPPIKDCMSSYLEKIKAENRRLEDLQKQKQEQAQKELEEAKAKRRLEIPRMEEKLKELRNQLKQKQYEKRLP